MRRTILVTAAITASHLFCTAQILNAGFEEWTSGPNCMNPTNWGTLNGSTGILGICTAERESDNVHGGDHALRLSTEHIGFPIDQTAPGIATNGTINTTSQQVEGGHAFSDRPELLTGWYVASPQNDDEYSYSALLINETTGDTIGRAEWSGTDDVTEWTMFSAPVEYLSDDWPTLIQIILLPSRSGSPQVGSTITFDDLGHEGFVNSVEERSNRLIRPYPNPASDRLFFHLDGADILDIAIFDMLGAKVAESRLGPGGRSMDVSLLPRGLYMWQARSVDGRPLRTGKIAVTR